MQKIKPQYTSQNCHARPMDRILYQCLTRAYETCSFSMSYKNLSYCCHPDREDFMRRLPV